MPSTYTIALRLPESTQSEIHSWYKNTYNREVSVPDLHVSAAFSFEESKLDAKGIVEIVQRFLFRPFSVGLSDLAVYTATEFAVVALTFNEQSMTVLNHFNTVIEEHLRLNLGGLPKYDVSVFSDGILPKYEPHVSLEYNVPIEQAKEAEARSTTISFTFMLSQAAFVIFENKDGKLSEHEVPILSTQDKA